jgi:hypothetical protein
MARYGMREVADVTFYDLATGEPVLFLDTLKMSDLTIDAKSVDAVGGRGGNRLLTWDYGRTVTLDVQDALLNPKALAALTGNPLQTGAQTVHKREVLVAQDNGGTGVKVTLSQTPVAGSVKVYKTTDGYDQTTIQASDVTVTGSEVDIAQTAGVAAGDKVIVYYQYQTDTNSMLIEITADAFPSFYKIVGDTLVRNHATGLDEPYQIVIAKAKLMPGFKLTLEAEGNSPTVFDFKLEAYKPSDMETMVQFIKY